MLPQSIQFLFSVADNYSLTVYSVLALIWLVALGCYIEEKARAWRRATISRRISRESERGSVNIDRFGTDLVAKAPARL